MAKIMLRIKALLTPLMVSEVQLRRDFHFAIATVSAADSWEGGGINTRAGRVLGVCGVVGRKGKEPDEAVDDAVIYVFYHHPQKSTLQLRQWFAFPFGLS